jgi:hypothetical protein
MVPGAGIEPARPFRRGILKESKGAEYFDPETHARYAKSNYSDPFDSLCVASTEASYGAAGGTCGRTNLLFR